MKVKSGTRFPVGQGRQRAFDFQSKRAYLTGMIPQIFKKIFWSNFDRMGTNVLLSLIWVAFHLPVFFCLYMLITRKVMDFNWYVLCLNFLMLSPMTAGLQHATMSMVNGESGVKHLPEIFRGTVKYWWKALLIFIVSTIVILCASNALIFYIKKVVDMHIALRIAVSGIVFWILVFFLLMQYSFFPFMIRLGTGVGKTLYKSFLLVLGNPFQHLFFLATMLSLSVIFIFSILGFLLLWPAFFFLSCNIFSMGLLSKYNKTIVFEEEKRKFRNLVKPWE